MTFAAILIVALLHVGFMLMETVFWPRMAVRMFGFAPDQVALTSTLAANQGFYNLILAAGLFWALWQRQVGNPAAFGTAAFFLGSICAAAVFGAVTASPRILLVQGAPAAIALLLLAFKH